MNLYRSIDRSRIQFDFLVNELGTCDYDKEIDELGGKMFEVPRYNIANYPVYRRACQAFFSNHHHPVVHGHIGLPAPIYLSIARRHGRRASPTAMRRITPSHPVSLFSHCDASDPPMCRSLPRLLRASRGLTDMVKKSFIRIGFMF